MLTRIDPFCAGLDRLTRRSRPRLRSKIAVLRIVPTGTSGRGDAVQEPFHQRVWGQQQKLSLVSCEQTSHTQWQVRQPTSAAHGPGYGQSHPRTTLQKQART